MKLRVHEIGHVHDLIQINDKFKIIFFYLFQCLDKTNKLNNYNNFFKLLSSILKKKLIYDLCIFKCKKKNKIILNLWFL